MTRRVRGFALVTVLWVAVLMGLFVAGTLDAVDRGARQVQGAGARLAAEALTEAGLSRALWVLKTQGVTQSSAASLRPDGLIWHDTLAGGQIAVQIVPADSLIDLNTAGDVVLADLAAFLSAQSSEPAEYDGLLDALIEARGQHLSLRDVAGIAVSPALSAKQINAALQVVTVGSGRATPILATAPRRLLGDVVGIEDETLDALLSARRDNQAQNTGAYDYPGSDVAPVKPPRGPVWHIRVAARSGKSVTVARGWAVFLPLPEMRAKVPHFTLESWPISLEDALVAALDNPLRDKGD